MSIPDTPNIIANEFEDLSESGLFQIPDSYEKVDLIVNKSFLPLLDQMPIVPIEDAELEADVAETVCLFPIEKIVYDKEENNLQKLASTYSSASSASANIVLLIRGYAAGETELFLGAADEKNRINGAFPKASILLNSFKGNFPGCGRSSFKILDKDKTRFTLNKCFDSDYQAAVSVSCVASLRGKQSLEKNSFIYQGMEKIIESMAGKDYTVVVISRVVSPAEIQLMQNELSTLYTQLCSFSKITLSANRSEADSISNALTQTLTEGMSNSYSSTLSSGESHSKGHSRGTFTSNSWGLNAEFINFSQSFGENRSDSTSDGSSTVIAEGKITAGNVGKSQGKTKTVTNTSTNGKSLQITLENKKITDTIANITRQLQRLNDGNGIGMFATAAYILAPSLSDARIGACTYKAIVSGDNTHLEMSGLNSWTGENYYKVADYLKRLRHPVFSLGNKTHLETTTPATLVTSSELALHMGLPQKSINGVSVRESVSFGRNIQSINYRKEYVETFELGNLFHLGNREAKAASLDLQSMAMHTFVTGTTGSGKSNCIYHILDQVTAAHSKIHFMVIEPAKGEYKAVFGSKPDVSVYGTNPYITPLLRINPFSFCESVHVLEHIDRLMGIFNVCWPMEAAMPAILKQALERGYQGAGWDLRRSKNQYYHRLFPTFDDIMIEVEQILEESKYSADNKGDYVGALCTRLHELTTGLNGMIFQSNELSDADLFESNVIVDLSRIGSSETKALIMGILVIKLQEYRLITKQSVQAKLNHITVLEEAHNLLKRTSTEQHIDSANLVGKSVEMLTNALAEMRSAGEGFIIADQSPGMLDKSAIRNTNTKIVMRLPDFEDRELVGKAMGLNEMQIGELSGLPTGIAAVYQNDWLECVLAAIPCFHVDSTSCSSYPLANEPVFDDEKKDRQLLLRALMSAGNGVDLMLGNLEGDTINEITNLHLSTKVKKQLINYSMNTGEKQLVRLGKVACDFFNIREAIRNSSTTSLDAWIDDFLSYLEPSIAGFNEEDQYNLLLIISSEYARRFVEFEPVYLKLSEKLV